MIAANWNTDEDSPGVSVGELYCNAIFSLHQSLSAQFMDVCDEEQVEQCGQALRRGLIAFLVTACVGVKEGEDYKLAFDDLNELLSEFQKKHMEVSDVSSD